MSNVPPASVMCNESLVIVTLVSNSLVESLSLFVKPAGKTAKPPSVKNIVSLLMETVCNSLVESLSLFATAPGNTTDPPSLRKIVSLLMVNI